MTAGDYRTKARVGQAEALDLARRGAAAGGGVVTPEVTDPVVWAVALRLAEGDWTRWGESPHRKWDWVGMDDRAVLAQQWVPTAEWLRANPTGVAA